MLAVGRYGIGRVVCRAVDMLAVGRCGACSCCLCPFRFGHVMRRLCVLLVFVRRGVVYRSGAVFVLALSGVYAVFFIVLAVPWAWCVFGVACV